MEKYTGIMTGLLIALIMLEFGSRYMFEKKITLDSLVFAVFNTFTIPLGIVAGICYYKGW